MRNRPGREARRAAKSADAIIVTFEHAIGKARGGMGAFVVRDVVAAFDVINRQRL
jgi:hypothetical protein